MASKAPLIQNKVYNITLTADATPGTIVGQFKVPVSNGGLIVRSLFGMVDAGGPTIAIYVFGSDVGASTGDLLVPDAMPYDTYKAGLLGYFVLSSGTDPADGTSSLFSLQYSGGLDTILSPVGSSQELCFVVLNADASVSISSGRTLSIRLNADFA